MTLSKIQTVNYDEESQRKDKKEKDIMDLEYTNMCKYVYTKKTRGLTYQPEPTSFIIYLERIRKLQEVVHTIQEFQLQILPESHIKMPLEILQAFELEIGDKITAILSEDKVLIMEPDSTKKGLFEEIDEIPYDDEELSKKESKLIKKAIKQCKKGKTVSWEELKKNDKIWN